LRPPAFGRLACDLGRASERANPWGIGTREAIPQLTETSTGLSAGPMTSGMRHAAVLPQISRPPPHLSPENDRETVTGDARCERSIGQQRRRQDFR